MEKSNQGMVAEILTLLENSTTAIASAVWGLPLVLFLLGGGIYLLVVSRFLPLRGFFHAFKLLFGKFHHENDQKDEGQISHFQALSNALAATIGLGNISGVAIAIYQGGAGAVFWMWVAGFIGMNTKFFECTLSLLYRSKDHRGDVQGGPMYVIEKALPKAFKPLAIMFAVCGLCGTLAIFQTNQVASFLEEIDPIQNLFGALSMGDGSISGLRVVVGIFSAAFVGIVLLGGLKRIAHVTSATVPAMCVLYVLCCLVIIFQNFDRVPEVFSSIFVQAFTGKALLGGATGVAFKEILKGMIEVMKTGVRRAAFSNEAGMGSAPMAHGNAKTSEPVSEGLVASVGPFIDTIIVCTMTALVILSSIDPGMVANDSGIALTKDAFEKNLGNFGLIALGLAVAMFSLSTMVGMANYNQKCWDYLFKGKFIFKRGVFIALFCLSLFFGAIVNITIAVNILDIGFALMSIPNMIATIWLARKVQSESEKYFNKYKLLKS